MKFLPGSLRWRLTLWYTAVLFFFLVLFGGGVFLVTRRTLYKELDRRLHEAKEQAEGALVPGPDGCFRLAPAPLGEKDDDREEDDEERAGWIEVLSREGKILYRSPWAARWPLPEGIGIRAFRPTSFDLGGGRFIRASASWEHWDGAYFLVRVARSERFLREALTGLLTVQALALPLILLLAGLGGYVLAGRALAPVDAMTERARKITSRNLSERLPVGAAGDELDRLARAFNEMFARLERAFRELRRFTADASHELRTPLTVMKSVGEVGLKEAREPSEYKEVLGSLLEEVERMARLVDTLLTLSRADAGTIPLEREDLRLSDLARETAGILEVLASEKGQEILVEEEGGAPPIGADRTLLGRALFNVLANAVQYSPDGTKILVRTGVKGGECFIEVKDQGPGIPREHLDRIFDRFYRVDPARSRKEGGTGLGLSLAKWAVEAHGGRIEVESEPGKGSTFRIVLPLSREEGGAGPT